MSAPLTLHPSLDELNAFGRGKLDAAVAGTMFQHLQACADCRRFVAESFGENFFDRFRADRPADHTPAPDGFGSTTAGAVAPGAPNAARAPASEIPPELVTSTEYANLIELGRGGMGVVYKAHNTLMGRDEVLKVMGQEVMARPGAVERFRREIQSAARLDHPNVVRAHSARLLGDLLVFSMEFVPGNELGKVVKSRGPLPVMHACFYSQQVANGLQHAHEKGMVHRDIKPANLILSVNGKRHTVKILDFGLAKMTSEAGFEGGLTGAGLMLGTPDYIAPEQIADAQSAGIRADIYSLGCTLYFLLTGHPPFQGTSLFDLLRKHHEEAPRPLNEVRPDVPPELAGVVARMMAKDAGQRFQTPGEVAKALTPFIVKSGPVPASPPRELPQFGMATVVPASTVASGASGADPKPTPVVAAGSRIWETIDSGPTLVPDSAPPSRPQPPDRSRRPVWLWSVVAAGALILLATGLWAGGAFKEKATDAATPPADHEPRKVPIKEPPVDPPVVLAPEQSKWAGAGHTQRGKAENPTGGSWTFTERRGGTFKALWHGGGGLKAVYAGNIDTTGQMTFRTREVLEPKAKAQEEIKGAGEVGASRMKVTIRELDDSAVTRIDFKLLPDGGDGFKFLGRWRCSHRPNMWSGFRTVTSNIVTTDRIPGNGPWVRDGGLLIVHFPGGGREWLIIDPDRPNELAGSNGVQSVTWVRQ